MLEIKTRVVPPASRLRRLRRPLNNPFTRECDVRRGRAVALIVGNYFHAVVLPNTNARVRGAKVDADGKPRNGNFLSHAVLECALFVYLCDEWTGLNIFFVWAQLPRMFRAENKVTQTRAW